jgi:Zn-dependent peptidase ImmA (M78 family)
MLSKYEQGQAVPSMDVLFALATALGIRLADLLTEPATEVRFVAFRKHSGLLVADQERIKARVSWQMEGRHVLSAALGEPAIPWTGPRLLARKAEDAERHALELRAAWGIGRQPVGSMVSLLEDRGVAVLFLDAPDKFHGISGWADGQAVIAVQHRDKDGARQRMDLAHELAHLVLSPDSNVDEEDYAKTFAGAFLFPESAAIQELGQKRSRLTRAELDSIKVRYGISIQAVLQRARKLDILAREGFEFWMMALSRRNQRRDEGEPYVGPEEPTRALQIASRALTSGLASSEDIRRWDLLPDSLATLLEPTVAEEEDDHAAQKAFLALGTEEREEASLAESEWMADFHRLNPDEIIPDFDDGELP